MTTDHGAPLFESHLLAYTRPIASIRTILVLVWLTQLATLAWLVFRG